MSNINLSQPTPQRPQIKRCAHDGAESGHSGYPAKSWRKLRVYGNESGMDLRIARPVLQQKVGLHRLPSYVTQRGGNNRDTQPVGSWMGLTDWSRSACLLREQLFV